MFCQKNLHTFDNKKKKIRFFSLGWEKCVNSTKHTKDPYHTHAFEWNVHKRRSTLYILYPSNIICCFWCCKICGKAVWLNFFLFWQMMVHLLFNATLPTLNYKLNIHQFYNWISSHTFHNKIIAEDSCATATTYRTCLCICLCNVPHSCYNIKFNQNMLVLIHFWCIPRFCTFLHH